MPTTPSTAINAAVADIGDSVGCSRWPTFIGRVCGTARRVHERRLLTWEGWAKGDQRQTVQMLSCPDLPRDAAAGGLIQDDATAARCAATTAMRAPDA